MSLVPPVDGKLHDAGLADMIAGVEEWKFLTSSRLRVTTQVSFPEN